MPADVARRARLKACTFILAGGLFAVACTSGGETPASSTTASAPVSPGSAAALCRSASALRDSVHNLTSLTVGAGTVSEITADLADVEAKFSAFVSEAGSQAQAQTAAVKSALAALETAVTALARQPSAAAAADVTAAFGAFGIATRNLFVAITPQCPAMSPSPSP